jgi:hypothetical protein
VPRRKNARTQTGTRGRFLAAASALGIAALAAPAAALAVPNEPPALPHTIIAFPQRDFVSAAGFAQGENVTISVIRNGVEIGTTPPIAARDDTTTPGVFDGIVEVNHPGGGCWTGTTPDILPGDVVRTTVEGTGVQDQTTVANVTTEVPTNPSGGKIVVHGTAQKSNGQPLPDAQVEQRFVSTGNLFQRNNKRTLRAGGAAPVTDGGAFAWDAAGSVHWTVTYTGLSQADVSEVMASDPRGLWLGQNPGTLAEMTIFESSFNGGPTAPCSAPLASNGVTSTDHVYLGKPTVNSTNAGSEVKLSGVTQSDTTAVSVQIGDSTGATTAIVAGSVAGAPGPQTWTATIPPADVAKLLDGTLTASATYTTPLGAIGGTPLSITKDTVAPSDPGATPGPGTYQTSQAVSLTGSTGATTHYTVDGSAPNDATPTATGQIMVTNSLTLRAIAIDSAGNTSVIKDFPYVITPPPPPAPAPPAGGTQTSSPAPGPAVGANAALGGSATASGTGSARPVLALKQLGIASRMKQGKAQKNGLRLTMRLADGTEVVKVNIYRKTAGGLKLLSSGYKAPSSAAGPYRVVQNHAALRHQLTKGSYEVQVTPGYSKAEMGTTRKAAFTVV